MKLQQKVRYGVACLYELSKRPGEYVDSETIATNQQIPRAYAHKILQNMARSGLILAHKGLGYKLARPLEDITAAEIIDTLITEPETKGPSSAIGDLLENKINQALSHVTLGGMIDAI